MSTCSFKSVDGWDNERNENEYVRRMEARFTERDNGDGRTIC